MDNIGSAPLFAAGLFIGMLAFLELGRRLGIRRMKQVPEGGIGGFGLVEGAVFSLFGLLIAFTLSGAASRFDSRRQLIAQEANDIGTAYLRLDLLPGDARPVLKDLFRKYLDSRVAVFRKLPDIEAAIAENTRAAQFQDEIWSPAVIATRGIDAHPDAAKLLLPALNAMIDITTTSTS